MANGITDLGNNIGYLYKTLADGTTIMAVERNTIEGAKSIQQMGVTNGPIVAGRGAQGEIVVTSSGGAGDITNIDVAGVNQIPANITVVSTNTSVVAAQIAAAINGYTPPTGYKFTASVVGNRVYLFSSPADGAVVNGELITVSVTNPGIVTATVDFANGSSDFGVYDNTLGYRFWINADYSGTATPYSKGVKAVEITEYITVRGMQSGVITISRNINGDRITSISRSNAITQVIVDTQSSTPADVLAYINPSTFVEGDVLVIRGTDPTRIVTLEDATVTTSTAPTPNIYLTDKVPCSLVDYTSVQLQFRNDPILGPIWVENARSQTAELVSVNILLAQFIADATAGVLRPGVRYFITNLLTGVYVYAIDGYTYEPSAILVRYVPQNYTACWRSSMAAPTINQYYRYYQNVYRSVTGNIGTPPSGDAVNWQIVATSNTTLYATQYHNVILTEPSLISIWPVVQETDGNGNCVIQAYQHFISSGVNAFNVFCWSVATGVNFYNNYVFDSIFDTANSDGSVYENIVTGSSNFSSNTMDLSSVINRNTFANGSIIQGNDFRLLTGNNVNSGLIQNNSVGPNKAPNITFNTLDKGYIIGNSASSNSAFIRNNKVESGSSIQLNNLNTVGIIEANTLSSTSQLQNCDIINNTNPTHVFNNTFTNMVFEYIQSGAGDATTVYSNTFNNGAITLINTGASTSIFDSVFNNTTISNWRVFGANKANFENCNITVQLKCLFQEVNITNWVPLLAFDHTTIGVLSGAVVNTGVSSNLSYELDLDNVAIYAANILTIPYNMSLASQFTLIYAAAAATIDEVVSLPDFQKVVFYNDTLGTATFTFNKVAPAAWSGNLIVGAANFVLDSDATGTSDYMVMAKYNGAVNMIVEGVNFV